MNKSAVFILFCVGITTLAILQLLAIGLGLYWIYPWLDIPMHFFGGLVVVLGYYILRERIERLPDSLAVVLAFVVVVGTLWELYEHFFGIPPDRAFWFSDTLLDFGMNILGALLGVFVARRLRVLD
jgi:hypothetical protein